MMRLSVAKICVKNSLFDWFRSIRLSVLCPARFVSTCAKAVKGGETPYLKKSKKRRAKFAQDMVDFRKQRIGSI